jgi:hypothetical protein
MPETRQPARRRRFRAVARRLGLIALLAGPVAAMADADTYKWTDAQGQVHYGDTPPAGVPFEVVAAPHAPPAPAAARAPAAPVAPPAAAATAGPEAAAPTVDAAAQDQTCVEALYQVTLLNRQQPVFKLAADGSRRYLEDAERPAELARLELVRDATCSDDPATRQSQARRADQLMIAMSPKCAEARDKLANSEDPATHTPDDQIARERAFVEQNCRGGERLDLWRGDWIRVRR